MKRALWIVQILLALLFLFAGGMKLVMSAEDMAQMPMSVSFMRFIGVVEVLGGLGLVLPTLTGIVPILTPLAAAGLVIIMIGAVVMTAASGAIGPALFPLVTGVLLAYVAYGRWQPAT